MFRATWAISAGIYGARFQRFCERHLDLGLGTATIGDREEIPDTSDDLKQFLTNAEDKDILGFREIEIVGEFLKSFRPPDGQSLQKLFVLPFRMTVRSPRNDKDTIQFNFGFALASFAKTPQGEEIAEIAYFRIRNYVRKMGLARQALIALQKNYTIRNAIPEASDKQIQDLRRTGRGESILEALPTLEAFLKFDRTLQSIPPRQKA
jgi:hypothetical protein